LRYISAMLTLAAIVLCYFSTRDYPDAAKATPFHEAIATQATLLPDKLGDWLVIDKPQPPPAAQQLLRPNAIITRKLRRESDGMGMTFIVVQCRDARDMAGHYPPNCYPAHGWTRTPVEGAIRTLRVNSWTIPVEEYEFRQFSFEGDRNIRIYNFFILPGAGFVSDKPAVDAAAENYRMRPFGAAQVQLVFDAQVPREQAAEAARDVLGSVGMLIEQLKKDPTGTDDRAAADQTTDQTTDKTSDMPVQGAPQRGQP
jgi:hypothetical protein